jgi:spore coat polysaccharide biosynthesis protein SpsF
MAEKVVAIIQARMGSSRLPGKVLLDIGGEPMLVRVVERTRRARTVHEVIVATTVERSDDEIAALCADRSYPVYRGSMHDVLDRYYQAARAWQAGTVVRITADCPVIDPALIDETVALVLGHWTVIRGLVPFDFAANRLPPPFTRTYPIGLDVEVCTFAALERAWKESTETFHREHVMPYLYEGTQLETRSPRLSQGNSPRNFTIALLNDLPDYGSLRWTVDTPEDLELLRQIYARFGDRDDFTWRDVLDLWLREPALAAINAGVPHKKLYDVDERAADL